MNTSGVSFLLPAAQAPLYSIDLQSPDLAAGWCVHPVHRAATSGAMNLLRVCSQHGVCLLCMSGSRSLPLLKHVRKHNWARQEHGHPGCAAGTARPSEMEMLPLPGRAPTTFHHTLTRQAGSAEQDPASAGRREGRVRILTSGAAPAPGESSESSLQPWGLGK